MWQALQRQQKIHRELQRNLQVHQPTCLRTNIKPDFIKLGKEISFETSALLRCHAIIQTLSLQMAWVIFEHAICLGRTKPSSVTYIQLKAARL